MEDRPQQRALTYLWVHSRIDLLVGALKDGSLLEGVGLLLLHDAPLAEGGVENSFAEIEPSSHLNLFTTSQKCCLLSTWNMNGINNDSMFIFKISPVSRGSLDISFSMSSKIMSSKSSVKFSSSSSALFVVISKISPKPSWLLSVTTIPLVVVVLSVVLSVLVWPVVLISASVVVLLTSVVVLVTSASMSSTKVVRTWIVVVSTLSSPKTVVVVGVSVVEKVSSVVGKLEVERKSVVDVKSVLRAGESVVEVGSSEN